MGIGGIDEDATAPSYTLEGLLSLTPVDAQDDEVALDGFLLGARHGQWSEFVDYASQAFGSSGIGDDDLVASGDKVAGDGPPDAARADDSNLHF